MVEATTKYQTGIYEERDQDTNFTLDLQVKVTVENTDLFPLYPHYSKITLKEQKQCSWKMAKKKKEEISAKAYQVYKEEN